MRQHLSNRLRHRVDQADELSVSDCDAREREVAPRKLRHRLRRHAVSLENAVEARARLVSNRVALRFEPQQARALVLEARMRFSGAFRG